MTVCCGPARKELTTKVSPAQRLHRRQGPRCHVRFPSGMHEMPRNNNSWRSKAYKEGQTRRLDWRDTMSAGDLHQSISMNYPTLEFSRLLPAGTLLHLDLSILRSGRCAISSIRRKSAGGPAKHPPRSEGLCLCTLECRAHAIWNLQILQDPCGRYQRTAVCYPKKTFQTQQCTCENLGYMSLRRSEHIGCHQNLFCHQPHRRTMHEVITQ